MSDVRAKSPDTPINRWIDRLGLETTVWLAAPPLWTAELAATSQLPLPKDTSLEGLIDLGVRSGLLERQVSFDLDLKREERFWISPSVRGALLTDLTTRCGAEKVRAIAAGVAKGFQSAPTGALPPSAVAWSQLAMSTDEPNSHELVASVRQLVFNRDLEAAADRIDSAEGIVAYSTPTFAVGVARAKRLLYLGRRQAQDRRRLAEFVECADQLEAMRSLLNGPTDAWAMHLVGVGGVGKTMLIRYVASGMFAEHNQPSASSAHDALLGAPRVVFPVALVDFDNLSPDYPRHKPLQLLLEIEDELALWADTEPLEHIGDRFLSFTESAHAIVVRDQQQQAERDRLVDQAIELFGSMIDQLSYFGNRKVLIILDTCEELAKLHLGGGVEAIESTFSLMERLHARAPALRVLFAGRRYLARQYANETLRDDVARQSIVSDLPRPYLHLLRTRGFNRRDATAFVGRPFGDRTGERTPPADIVAAILEKSPELAGQDYPADPDRFNPYDLDMFREWWRKDADLTAETLRSAGSDAYVEGRIARRLDDDRELHRALFVAALLGRFDEPVLDAAIASSSTGVGDAVDAVDVGTNDVATTARSLGDRLAEQEWVEVAYDRGRSIREFHVAEGLRERLYSWATAQERESTLLAVRAQLARILEDGVRTSTPVDELRTNQIVSALRLDDNPVDLWMMLERRVEESNRWGIFEQVLPFVRGELSELIERMPLFAAVLSASLVAVARRTNLLTSASLDDCESRLEMLQTHTLSASETEQARILTARVCFADADAADVLAILGGTGDLKMLRLAPASFVAAAERLANTREPGETTVDVDTIRALVDELHPRQSAALVVAAAHLLGPAAASLRELADDMARRALQTAQTTWADWPEQDGRDPLAWLMLHRLAGTVTDGAVLDFADARRRARRLIATIDGDRLMSAALLAQLESVVLTRAELDELVRLEGAAPAPVAWAAAHHRIDPLFVTLAKARYVAGSPEEARELLRARRTSSHSRRDDDETVVAADDGLLWLAVRMRDPSIATTSSGSSSSSPPNQLVHLAAGALFGGSPLDEYDLLSSSFDELASEVSVELFGQRSRMVDVLTRTARDLAATDLLTAFQLQLVLYDAGKATESDLRFAYSNARRLRPDLPADDALATAGQRSDPLDPIWRPWLDRLSAALTAGPRMAASVAPAGARPSGTAQRARPASQRLRETLWGLAGFLGAAVGFYFIGETVAGWFDWHQRWQAALSGIGAFALLGAALVLLEEVSNRFNQIALRFVEIRVRIGGRDARREAAVEVELRHVILRPLLAPLLGALSAWRVLAKRGRAEYEISGPLPTGPPLVNPKSASGLVAAHLVTLHWESEDDRALAWERALVDPDVDSSAWRAVFARPVGTVVRRPWSQTSGVAIRCPSQWSRFLSSIYGSIVVPFEDDDLGTAVSASTAPRMLHVMGTPTATGRGSVIRTSRAADTLSDRVAALASVDELGVRDCPLVVVQGVPYDGGPLAPPLEEAILALDLVHAIAAAGAGTVLYVPALEQSIAKHVVDRLAAVAHMENAPSPTMLADLVGVAKGQVVATGAEFARPREARLLAQDFILITPTSTGRSST